MIDLSKKMRNADDYIKHLYVHTNELNQFVIFSGLNSREFISSVGQLDNLLLLKHHQSNDEEGSFNMHTRLAFIEQKEILKFAKMASDQKRDLCWMDFKSEKKLNLLTPQEQAELLYIGHKKEPIRSPFYHQLQNRFVYLETKDEKLVKVYVRDVEEIFQIIVNVFNNLISVKERAASFWRRRPMSIAPTFNEDDCNHFREELNDGALISVYRIEKPKVAYVLEVRNVSEYSFVDEIWDDLNNILKYGADKTLQSTTK